MIKMFVKKTIMRLFGESADDKVRYLKSQGAVIGENVKFYGNSVIDKQFPFMLQIGDYTEITDGVVVLNHDYSWSVIKRYYGTVVGGVGPVIIGKNCFIGTRAIILMNTTIGDNCIIGAGSVVSGTFPSNSVIAGVPARVICSLEDYYNKKINKQYKEASEVVRNYRRVFECDPPEDKLPAYFWLFHNRTENYSASIFNDRMHLKNNYDQSLEVFMKSKPLFESYDDFLKSIE